MPVFTTPKHIPIRSGSRHACRSNESMSTIDGTMNPATEKEQAHDH
jgi:hypothetical protein